MSYYENADKFSINENSYDDMCLKYGKYRVDREIDLELESKDNAYNAFMSKRNKAISDNNLANIGTTKVLLSETIPAMVKGLDAWFAKVNNGKCGKRHRAASLANTLKSEEIAFIVSKTILSNTMSRIGLTHLSVKIGEAIEDEVRFNTILASMSPKEVQSFKAGMNKRIAFQFRKRYAIQKEKHLADEDRVQLWNKWSQSDKFNVGMKMVELFALSTSLIHIVKVFVNGNIKYFVELDADVAKYVDYQDNYLADLMMEHRPMVIPPKPWTNPFDGGYYINLKKPLQLVRMSAKDCDALYSDVDMPTVYKAVNAIQDTAWHINNRVLEVANAVCSWEHIPEALEMPTANPAEPPVRPIEADTNKDIQREWRQAMTSYYQEDNKRKAKRILVNCILKLANDFKDDEAIYFPHNLDFRGRVYPVTLIHPQGNDFMKSMLEFSEGVELGKDGHTWLAFQGANMWGLDKKPIEERISWVYENSDMIISIAEKPLDNLQWTEADSPWEFLAFCFEWNDYLKIGESFKSKLAVAFDGSCSGLQHFSAMLRDSVGGEAVNLKPDDHVHDIYGIVAEKVKELLKKDMQEGTDDTIEATEDGSSYLKKGTKSLAKEWLDHGVSRSVTKRPTMTLCYGAGKFGFADQILEDTVYPALAHNPLSFSKPSQSARYMAGLIWDSLKGVVVKAVEAMEWLQTASGLLAKDKNIEGKNLSTTWITPAGFPVKQKYPKVRVKRLNTVLSGSIKIFDTTSGSTEEATDGSVLRLAFAEPTDEIDSRKQKQGIAPNFVHSMDASHLMLTVCACVDKGVNAFAMIHDSYGVPAGYGSIMFTTVREVFVSTYTENDVLQDLHDHICNLLSPKMLKDLPEVPTKGDLDLDCAKESMYAFS
jgi:DNA-directed RNA polymerase|nr:MAG TPA: DNA directed RNA polymerase [Caudoviricetes sp.]